MAKKSKKAPVETETVSQEFDWVEADHAVASCGPSANHCQYCEECGVYDSVDYDADIDGDVDLDDIGPEFEPTDETVLVPLSVHEITVGDVVVLNSGGPEMTVTEIDEDNGTVICNYFVSEDSEEMSEILVPTSCVTQAY